jgi:Holliday junction resolvasome RuvABC endonuclease subunit
VTPSQQGPRVCGLDISLTATGYATPEGGYGCLTPKKLHGAERLSWLRDEVLTLEHAHMVELFAIEGFAFGVKNSRSHEIGGAGWVVRTALWDAGISWVDIPPASLKKYATGKGNAGKPEMQAAAYARLGYREAKPDDNVIDALWLRALVLDKLGCPVVEVPKVHREALVKVSMEPWEGVA